MRKSLQRSAGSFRYALAGLRYLFSTQPNARIHLVLACLAIALGLLLRLAPAELAILALTIGFVLALEALNSAVEALVDLLQPEIHPLAAIAKDVAAGAVLLAALSAVAVALFLFLPRLWRLLV